MNNQIILWGFLILPWFTLFFIKKEEVKRFMPAALFTAVTSMLIADIGAGLGLWEIKETIYPLNEIFPLSLGVFPVATLWFLKFLYGRFWLYSVIQLIFSIAFAYLLLPWLNGRGIIITANGASGMSLLFTVPHFVLIYLYHMWQETLLERTGAADM